MGALGHHQPPALRSAEVCKPPAALGGEYGQVRGLQELHAHRLSRYLHQGGQGPGGLHAVRGLRRVRAAVSRWVPLRAPARRAEGNGNKEYHDRGRGGTGLPAGKAGENLRLGSEAVGKMIADAKLELDRKNLRPVFEEELLCGNEKREQFVLSKGTRKEVKMRCAGGSGLSYNGQRDGTHQPV